ncbi:MAG: YihY/virulence factor BrkB family protein [Gaiellaceae bacterium]
MTDNGRAPAHPARLSWTDWVAVLKRAVGAFLRDDCMGLSQEIAFSAMLAFFPAIAFFLGLLGVLHLYDQLQSFLGSVAPHGVIHFIEGLQRDSKGSAQVAALVLGGIGAVWAASGAMTTVIKAVNRAYERMETRPFWKVRGLAIMLVLLFGVTILALAVLIVFGGPIGHAIANRAHLGSAFDLLWSLLRWPIAFVAVLILYGLVYYYAPNKDHPTWKWVTPGSFIGALMWLALSGLFTLYVTFAGSYSKTYGTLAAGVILMLWLNYSAWSLLFGAELNSELDKQADIRAAGGEHAGLVKPVRRA